MPVIVMTNNEIDEFIKRFKDYMKEPTNEYMKYFLKFNNASVSIYNSNKVVFQGSDLSLFTDYINLESTNDFDYDLYDTIGADEVGTGDTFGPIVCASMFVPKNKVNDLKDKGIKDSKKITDETILELGEYLIRNYKFKVTVVRNENYNDHFNEYNMNAMKAKLHNNNITLLSNEVDYQKVVLDEFVNKDKYFEYLNNSGFKDICFEMKGESKSIAVAGASIIARFYFLKEMERLSKEYKYDFKKGSGKPAQDLLEKIKNDGNENILYHVCKLNFKNVK